jgi:hypothetical protein
MEGPLSGVLRDLDQRARRMENRRRPSVAEAEPGPPGAPGKPGPPGPPGRTVAAAVVSTVPGGRAVWCPDPAHGELVVSAVVAGPGGPYTVSVLEDGPGRVVLQVWELVRHGRGMRWTEAGVCVRVHVTGSRPDEPAAGDV